MNQGKKTKGYVIVASRATNFYKLAINLAESVFDYYPEAKITLFTEERFVDDRAKIFDQVIYCDDNYRAKLWGMARSPYDITFYMDADMECVHEDISTVFDHLGDHDMVFTPITKENSKGFQFRFLNKKAEREKDEHYTLKHNGGVCLYDMTKPKVREFMNEWQEKYYAQREDYSWWPQNEDGENDYQTFPQELRFWDQFTLWWLLFESDKYNDLDVAYFGEDWYRWNYYSNFRRTDIKPTQKPILLHYSSAIDKWNDNRFTRNDIV